MKKRLFKFTCLFFVSLNLFASEAPRTDFMQKDFKLTLDWLQAKPKSSARDFFILQYISDPNISYENAKKAYDMRNGRSALLTKTFNAKTSTKITPEERDCYNATTDQLKSSNSRCIALALNFKKASDLSIKDLNFFLNKIDEYPTLKKELQILALANPYEHLINSGVDTFLKVFFNVSDSFRIKYFNKHISPTFLNQIAKSKDFERFLKLAVYDKNFKTLQKSLDIFKNRLDFEPNILFILGINYVNNNDLTSAKNFFETTYNKSYLRGAKDKNLFWLYLVTNDKNYLNELSGSFDVNIYSLYAKELLNIEPDNIIYNVNLKNQASSFDIYDSFKWDEVAEDTKKNLDEEKLQKYYNLFSSKETEPHMAFVLERYAKYKEQYFITPYRDIVEKYDINKQVLIYSISRQESRFIPSSVSFASAQGMMQIMPFLSEEIAQKTRQTYDIYNQFTPLKNIEFASFHLDSLINQFDSNPLFIAYAYNGGAGYTRTQLKKLFKNKNKFEPFLSMEMISLEETKEYGKKVLTNYYIYNNHLNSENKISLSTILQSLVSPY